jgi:outer membrane protein TolC
METHNVLAARENLIIATERFRLGDLSGLEFREAQRNFVSAESRLLNARLQVKLSETNLLQLAGELVIN